MVETFKELLTQASARGSRSTALHPLGWALGIILAALPACLWAHAPDWLLIGLGVSAALMVILYAGAYIYLLISDRDALRSERFTLSKLAIEKGLVGDNISGLKLAQTVDSRVQGLLTSIDGDQQ
jgi:hypothetical protein